MKKIAKMSMNLFTSGFFVSQIVVLSDKNQQINNEKLKIFLSKNIQLLQKNVDIINNQKNISELKKLVEKQISLIKKSNNFLNKNLGNFKVHFNVDYFNKFKNDFIQDSKLIIKPFEQKNEPNNQQQKIKSEIFRISAHTITIKNFLTGAYNSLLNKNVFNPLDDWQKISLDQESYEYYKPILNKKGQELFESLKKLISDTMEPPIEVKLKTHVEKNYDSLWNLFQQPGFKDLQRGKEHFILDIYSKNPLGKDAFNFTENYQAKKLTKNEKRFLGSEYQREHIIPQSSFKPNKDESELVKSPMYFDAHHIFPVDGVTNRIRSNNSHGIVVTPIINEKTKMANESKIGFNEINQKVFEPVDAFKGDIARSYLYFAIRYNNQIKKFNKNTVFINQFPYIKSEELKTMIDWHENVDLVDMYDLKRNQQIYQHQKNRNPFIDIPYLSKWIWDKNYENQPLIFLKK